MNKRAKRDCCGDYSVCSECATNYGHKCHRCGQPLKKENPPAIWEVDSRHEKLRNWMLNWEGEVADPNEDRDWDYRCLECGQYFVERPRRITGGGYFVPVDSNGNPVECTSFPKVENGICESCKNKIEVINNHGENCRYWKAYKQLKEVTTSGGE